MNPYRGPLKIFACKTPFQGSIKDAMDSQRGAGNMRGKKSPHNRNRLPMLLYPFLSSPSSLTVASITCSPCSTSFFLVLRLSKCSQSCISLKPAILQPQQATGAEFFFPLSRCSCPQPGIHGHCGEAGGRGRQLAPQSLVLRLRARPCEVGGGTLALPLCRRRFQGVRNRCVCVVRGAGIRVAGAVPGGRRA